GITLQNFPNVMVRDFTLTGNAGLEGFGLDWLTTLETIPTSSSLTQYDASGNFIVDKRTGTTTETFIGGIWFPWGIKIFSSNNAVVQDVTVNNVFTGAPGFQLLDNGWAYRCTANVTFPMQAYTQWQMFWSNTTGGGCQDCTVNGAYMTPAFSSFSATGTHYIRATAINGGLDVNNVGGWLHQDTTITVTSGSGAPVWSINQPLMSISTATGSDLVAAGGTVDNINITIEGYLNANNDILTGINITQQIVNIQITGGSYVAPDYAAPSRLVGPQGIRAQG